jgi:hypothetical protein
VLTPGQGPRGDIRGAGAPGVIEATGGQGPPE